MDKEVELIEVDLIFEKSLYLLNVAEKNYDDKFYPDSINRSYYAVFHAAKALLMKKGITTKTHVELFMNLVWSMLSMKILIKT